MSRESGTKRASTARGRPQPIVTRAKCRPRGAGTEAGWARRSRCIRWSSRINWARCSREWRTISLSPMKHAQRRATESAIAAKPCPVILAIGIQPFLHPYDVQSACQDVRCLFSDVFRRTDGKLCHGTAQVVLCRHPEGRQLVTPQAAEFPAMANHATGLVQIQFAGDQQAAIRSVAEVPPDGPKLRAGPAPASSRFPSLNGMKAMDWPTRMERFQEPWKARKAPPWKRGSKPLPYGGGSD